MLKKHLIAKTRGLARKENIVFWEDYRVSVLTPRLFRLERSAKGDFRDEATQAIWYRDMPMQKFAVQAHSENCTISTGACRLILCKDRGQVCVEIKKRRILADNQGNLFGTYRTLDNCNGDVHFRRWIAEDEPYRIVLDCGVCAQTGVAVLDDTHSLPLGKDGQVKNVRVDSKEYTDEYIFAFDDDYLGAVRALYSLTGKPPLVPRYALGNWWSRYHVYTDAEYLRVLNRFKEKKIPLTVATIDMDWHYSVDVDKKFSITKSDRKGEEYVGKYFGWTGYSWNRDLFPNPKAFLRKIKEEKLKITLNVHPSDGVCFWEDAYAKMAGIMGTDNQTQKRIPFDYTYDKFINAYFDILHRPHEKMGVDFWWIDWQQPNIAWHGEEEKGEENGECKMDEGARDYDPLWALNHYHYLDNASGKNTPLILSRYAGVGSHRYPVGFSGDTEISWKTLAYLPYFTATASNVGYVWWSHDIGGHNFGEKSNELYVRHLQYGVFSPINRLHCTCDETMTKEPWFYGNGTGLIAEEFLRFRHRLIPYLYTASQEANTQGVPLVQPLYYQWKEKKAYEYPTQYLFGSQLLVSPVTEKAETDGFARVKVWLPKGKWTDIFTGDEFAVETDGQEYILYRDLQNIPVFAKSGGVLPLSADEGNGCGNPEELDIWAYEGNGKYALLEDGKEEGKSGAFTTSFIMEFSKRKGACTQSLTILGEGDKGIAPKNRRFRIAFKNIPDGQVSLYINGKKQRAEKLYLDYATVGFAYDSDKTYKIIVKYTQQSALEKQLRRAQRILTETEWENPPKLQAWQHISTAKTIEEYLSMIDKADLPEIAKLRLKETL